MEGSVMDVFSKLQSGEVDTIDKGQEEYSFALPSESIPE